MLAHSLPRALISMLLICAGAAAPASEITIGGMAPDFRLQDQNGEWHTLAQHRGQWVALYFYPKDDTPGCTKQACAFRDNVFAFDELGATILGISLDDVESHEKFAEKYSLPFSILADVGGATAERYGVLNDFMGMQLAKRESFLIDPEGRIVRHYQKVDPEKNSEQVLEDIRKLSATSTPQPSG